MKVWGPIFNFIAVIALIIYAASFINICQVIERDFEQAHYDYAVRQATEAMFRKTLRAEDIDLDYKDMSYVSIDSSEALEVFDRVMCANYNMAPCKENFSAINDSIAACVIAGNDGYYVLQHSDADVISNGVASDGYAPRFSAKIPYLISANNTVYAIDTYKKTYSSMSLKDKNANPGLYTVGANWPSGINDESAKQAANVNLRDIIVNQFENNKSVSVDINKLSNFRLFFPEITTVSGVNPFDPPAIFMLLDGAGYATTSNLLSMSVSGFKVIRKTNVVVFTDTSTNRSYYCYEGQLKDEERTASSGGVAVGGKYGPFEIENYYGSIREACEAVSPVTHEHYSPYYDILARKISTEKS